MSLRFLHTADWQLGKPFAGITDSTKRHAVQAERIAVLDRIATLAAEHQVAFVLVAGDIFDSPTPTRSLVSQFCAAVGRMGRPVFVIPGNHDHGGPGGVWNQPFFGQEAAALAPNLQLLLQPEPVILPEAVILPCPLLRRHESTDLTAWLRTPLALPDTAAHLPRIGLAHGSVLNFQAGSGNFSDDEERIAATNHLDLTRIPSDTYDYFALGDWHGSLQVNNKAWYAGTPEPDRFAKGDTNLPGHTLLVEVVRGTAPVVTRINTARLGWHEVAFTFREGLGLEALRAILDPLLGQRTSLDLLRLRLDGTLGLNDHAALAIYRETLEARLLRLKEDFAVAVEPSESETIALTQRTGDPLTVDVATNLVKQTADPDPVRVAVARAALRALHLALQPSL
jgi:DNA repair exonuclease SbcCD nuclease subunit